MFLFFWSDEYLAEFNRLCDVVLPEFFRVWFCSKPMRENFSHEFHVDDESLLYIIIVSIRAPPLSTVLNFQAECLQRMRVETNQAVGGWFQQMNGIVVIKTQLTTLALASLFISFSAKT